MERIRQRLLDENAGLKRSEEKRKEREGKKFGKQVQLEKIKERQQNKKDIEERLKGLKRSEFKALSILLPRQSRFYPHTIVRYSRMAELLAVSDCHVFGREDSRLHPFISMVRPLLTNTLCRAERCFGRRCG